MRASRKVVPFAVSATAVVAWLLTASVGAAEEPIGCGSVITQDTVLTHDLVDCENGVIVAEAGVTLDLGGRRIGGSDTDTGIGVSVQAPGVVVRNGTISGFRLGVTGFGFPAAGSPEDMRIENTTIRDNEMGVFLHFGSGDIVGNRILENHRFGVWNVDSGGLIEGNLVMRNGTDGMVLTRSTSVVTDNTFSANGRDGLMLDDSSPFWNSYRVGSNVADRNQRLGINMQGPVADPLPLLLDAGGNAARHNGDPQQCTVYIECARTRGQAARFAALLPILSRPAGELPDELARLLP